MRLSIKDAKLFFDLMWRLQFYVNIQKKILPDVTTLKAYSDLDIEDKIEVRNALWENPQLIDKFVQDNPDGIKADELKIIVGWKQFQHGRYIIERMLKKHAILLGDDQVFGVLGLESSFDEIIPKQALPLFVETVLLPFRDVIVYDGLLLTSNIFIGGNMASRFKETYLKAKRKGKIIVSFNEAVQKAHQEKTQKRLKDWKPQLKQLAGEAQSLRAQAGSPPTWGPAFSLIKASVAIAQTAVDKPEDYEALWEQFDKVVNALNRLEKGIHRS